MNKATKAIVAFLIVGGFCAMVLAVSSYLRGLGNTIPTSGTIDELGIEVYEDSACTSRISAIDWGILEPGMNSNVTIYVKNVGNASVMLHMSASNWSVSHRNGANTQALSLAWDYQGASLEPSQVSQITLTLSASPDLLETESSFDVAIYATNPCVTCSGLPTTHITLRATATVASE